MKKVLVVGIVLIVLIAAIFWAQEMRAEEQNPVIKEFTVTKERDNFNFAVWFSSLAGGVGNSKLIISIVFIEKETVKEKIFIDLEPKKLMNSNPQFQGGTLSGYVKLEGFLEADWYLFCVVLWNMKNNHESEPACILLKRKGVEVDPDEINIDNLCSIRPSQGLIS